MGKVRQAVHRGSKSLDRIRDPLEKLYKEYDVQHIPTDPLKFAYRFDSFKDREVVAFLSAVFAFGNVRSIFRAMEFLLKLLSPSPHQKLKDWPNSMSTELISFKHRWITAEDTHVLFLCLSEVLTQFDSIENFFMNGQGDSSLSLALRIDSFSNRFKEMMMGHCANGLTRGLTFMFPSPNTGSGCKRFNLFLRWVVRDKVPDLGLWKKLAPDELYLPIDTHLHRIIRYIGLTHRKNVTWKMVEEVSQRLKVLDPLDPVRFDFALSRLGILDQCLHRADDVLCPQCPLQSLCILNAKRLRNVA